MSYYIAVQNTLFLGGVHNFAGCSSNAGGILISIAKTAAIVYRPDPDLQIQFHHGKAHPIIVNNQNGIMAQFLPQTKDNVGFLEPNL